MGVAMGNASYEKDVIGRAATAIAAAEGFSPHAYRDGYWHDQHRCSIGYGTRAMNCHQRITHAKALRDMKNYIVAADAKLRGVAQYRQLSKNDKVRVLAFRYQRGHAATLRMLKDADRLVLRVKWRNPIYFAIKACGYYGRIATVERAVRA